mgnify:CR=1 FL=1|tara:strand:- start:89623 stop:90180 length:558 start_codon:yes stop_codon:yes gene_type:complete
MNCLYLHGFASAFDPNNEKVKSLSKYFKVIPFSYDTSAPYEDNAAAILEKIDEEDVSLVVGCSLGGFYALDSMINPKVFGVALNPTFAPRKSLEKYIGSNQNFKTTKTEILTADVVESYPKFTSRHPNALIYIEKGDTVIDPVLSYKFFSSHVEVVQVDGGSHRFESLAQQMNKIINAYNTFHGV